MEPVCHVWDLITFIKFQAFPYTPDELKQRVCKRIADINIYRREFHHIIGPMMNRNAFVEFERFIRRYRRWNLGYFNSKQKDIDILMEIFWAEENEMIAHRLMRAFMIFDLSSDELRTIWNVAINILYSKTCHDDTIAALSLLEAHSQSPHIEKTAPSEMDYIIIERHAAPAAVPAPPPSLIEPPISIPLIESTDKNDRIAEFQENLS
jgi:hypothetical protein